MNTRIAFPSSDIPRLRISFLVAITLPLILFSACSWKEMRRSHTASSSVSAATPSTNIYHLIHQLYVGMSMQRVASTIPSAFSRVGTNTYLDAYPFRDLLPELNPRAVTEWTTSQVQPDGWPEILFTVFSDANKTNLVDAFWFKDGSLTPVVDGLFGRNVRAIKPGDSIDTVYRLLGKRNAEYFRGPDGKWRVKLIYWAHRGRIYVVEADAAEGRVLRAGDGTI